MPTIVIKDLLESIDLDRQAMAAITGGARLRGRQPGLMPGVSPGFSLGFSTSCPPDRIFHYPGTPGLAVPQPGNCPGGNHQGGR